MELFERFKYAMLYKLRPRIMTLIVVTFLPISLTLIAMALTLLVNFSRDSGERALYELTLSLDRVESDAANVDNYADEFTQKYLTHLDSPSGLGDAMLPYDMIDDLGRWYSYQDLPGIVYLYDNATGKCYIKYYGEELSIADRERLGTQVERFAADAPTMNYALTALGGRYYACRTNAYRNCGAGFLIDAMECVHDALAERWDERGTIYLQGPDGTAMLRSDGSLAAMDADFDELCEDSFWSRSLVWQSELMGLRVCVRYSLSNALAEIPLIEWVLLTLSLVSLLMLPLIWRVLRTEILLPMDKLTHALNELRDGNEDYRINESSKRYSDEFRMLFDAFDQSAEQQKRAREREVQLVRTELDNLRLQINPHMLLNSYNLIFALAQSRDYQRIQDYSYLLVRYFRYVLRNHDDFVPLSQELEFIDNYVQIQAIRHPDAFNYRCKVQPDCERALIPPLLLENFIENSMKHALSPGKTIDIGVDIQREDGHLRIAVRDSGNGIPPEVLEQLRSGEPYTDDAGNRHIGIWNSMRRVELFYGEKASMNIFSAPGKGTRVVLRIPLREAEAKDERNAVR